MNAPDGTKIAERWEDVYAVHSAPRILRLIEELSRSEERERVLREALEKTVWRERSQFPKNPFCVICGAGKEWVAIHGHEPMCALATPAPEPENKTPCGYIYPGGAQCGYTENQCMHIGSSSPTIPLAGRHDYTPAQPSAENGSSK